MSHAYRLSRCLPVGLLLVAVAVAVPILWPARRDEPTVYRSSWCPRPEDRIMPVASLTKDQVIARLREIKAILDRLDGSPYYDLDDDPARVREARNLVFELIVDYDLATTPLEEPSRP